MSKLNPVRCIACTALALLALIIRSSRVLRDPFSIDSAHVSLAPPSRVIRRRLRLALPAGALARAPARLVNNKSSQFARPCALS